MSKNFKVVILSVIMVMVMAVSGMAYSNPFADVPNGHWAYDAVAQLSARGVVSGYPDGSYKGIQPATRYEMASVVARALAKVDIEKASKEDLEILKKLVMEFKDELDALGVKVDKIDKRVAVLEDRLGGWKLTGSFVFDAKFGSDGRYYEGTSSNEFSKEKFWLNLSKQIDERTSFFTRYRIGAYGTREGRGDSRGQFDLMYVDTKLPYDVDFRVGRFNIDFEGEKNMYYAYDANPMFGRYRADGFKAHKTFGNFDLTGIIARNPNVDHHNKINTDFVNEFDRESLNSMMQYIVDAQYNREKFFVGAGAYWFSGENYLNKNNEKIDGRNINTYTVYGGYNFTPAITLKGQYYWQNFDAKLDNVSDSAKAWKGILDIKQSVLKYTSLWIEYSQQDNNFQFANNRYMQDWSYVASVTDNRPVARLTAWDKTSKSWFIAANQQWGKSKWSSELRYANWNYDTDYIDSANSYGVGVRYQYTPAIQFGIFYDYIDYGNSLTNNNGGFTGTDNVVNFRTSVSF